MSLLSKAQIRMILPLATALVSVSCVIPVRNANAEKSESKSPVRVAATQESPASPSGEVVQEILKIQEQMGGSIVRDRPGLQGWGGEPTEPAPKQQILPAEPKKPASPIAALRHAAWQLECSAHQLEQIELYERADEMRKLAGKLRLDARELKNAEQKQYKSRF